MGEPIREIVQQSVQGFIPKPTVEFDAGAQVVG